MANRSARLSVLTDNNVPDSVGNYLRNRGHSVHRMRSHMAADSPDQVVATAAIDAARVLVSQDRDFNAQRFAKARFARLSRIALVGPGPTLVDALKQHIHLIELHWARVMRVKDGRMIVHVRVGEIRIRSAWPETAPIAGAAGDP